MTPDKLQNTGFDLASELIESGVEMTLATAGWSMAPTIRHGDRIVVQRASPDRLRPGDIVLWRSHSGYTAHRILYKQPDGASFRLTTKGDSRLVPDPPLSSDDIVGRIIGIAGAHGSIDMRSSPARMAAVCQLLYGRLLAKIARSAPERLKPERPGVRRLARRILLMPVILLGCILRHRAPNCRSCNSR